MLFAKSLILRIAVVPGGRGLEDPSRVNILKKLLMSYWRGAAQPSEYQGQELVRSCCKGQITTAMHFVSRRLNGPVPIAVASGAPAGTIYKEDNFLNNF